MRLPRSGPVDQASRDRPGFGIWLSLFLLGTCALVNLYSTQPILKEIGEWAGVSSSAAAWTVSLGTLGVATMAPVAGAISDRAGRKRVMVYAIVALAIGGVMCMVAPNFPALLAARFFQGLTIPFIFAVAVAYVADEFEPQWSVMLNSVYLTGMAFGGLIGRLMAGVAVEFTHNWRIAFVPLVIVPLIAAVVISMFLPVEGHFTASADFHESIVGLGKHAADWRILLTCLVGTGLLFQQVGSFTFAALHLLEPPFNFSPLRVSFVFVVMIFPTLVTPWVGRVIRRFGVWITYLGAMAVSASGMVLMLAPASAAVIAGLALSCVAVMAGQSCATRFVAIHATVLRSSAVGLYLMAFYFGGTLAVLICSPLYAAHGWHGVIYGILVAIVIGVVAATLAWRNRPAPHAVSGVA